ncbi:uncharacterized membrane protein (DUF485 family) [Nitrobacteraceae bacterium AZCC 1564]
MSKNPLQSLAAKFGRSAANAANDDVAPPERDQVNRDKVNMVTAMPPPDAETGEHTWTGRLVLFLRVMAVLSMIKGLYHWAQITGFIGGEDSSFEYQTTQWQTATVYFAVIELVAAVGLWLATPWGAVVWLTTIVSTAVIELMFPTIYGGNLFAVLVSAILLVAYLALAWMAARERPP